MELHDGCSAGLVLSPVCCLESCDLDTVSYRDGKRRQWRLCRMSTDINVDVRRYSWCWNIGEKETDFVRCVNRGNVFGVFWPNNNFCKTISRRSKLLECCS
jgi:hypothetical protein